MDAGQRVLAISCNRDCLVVILLAALGSQAIGVVGLVGLVTVIATITAFAMASPSRASDETSAARIASAAANNARSVRADCMLYMRGFNARIAMSEDALFAIRARSVGVDRRRLADRTATSGCAADPNLQARPRQRSRPGVGFWDEAIWPRSVPRPPPSRLHSRVRVMGARRWPRWSYAVATTSIRGCGRCAAYGWRHSGGALFD